MRPTTHTWCVVLSINENDASLEAEHNTFETKHFIWFLICVVAYAGLAYLRFRCTRSFRSVRNRSLGFDGTLLARSAIHL